MWAAIQPQSAGPPHIPTPRAGRPFCDDKAALRGILYLLREGCKWQSIPSKALDCPSGSTCWRRFQVWTAAGVWDNAHLQLLDFLGEEGVLDLQRVIVDSASCRRKRGAHTGRNPTDRGKKGCKRHVLTDADGIPLVVQTGPANQRDDTKLEDLLEAFPVLTDGDEQRTVHVQPAVLLGDRGYGFLYLIAIVLLYGIRSLLSPRGKDKPHGSGLGEQRYVVERTMSWWTHFRRINFCYERKGDHFQGLHVLAACVICANKLRAARARKLTASRAA